MNPVNLEFEQFIVYLKEKERSYHTISKYTRDIKAFLEYSNGRILSKDLTVEWKRLLMDTYAPASVNSMLAALNCYLDWTGQLQFRVKPLKIQKLLFSDPEKELSKEEYFSLVKVAKKNRNCRLALIMQAICSTGIRISELTFLTVESLQKGRTIVECKGKSRTVFLSTKLCQSLRQYCREKDIKSGIIFCTKKGKALNRSNIWREMKNLCIEAQVSPEKVFPHNLRHLFARAYYTLEKDLSRLADLLGHTSIVTTRIYTKESGMEHLRQLERMNLVVDE